MQACGIFTPPAKPAWSLSFFYGKYQENVLLAFGAEAEVASRVVRVAKMSK